VNPGLTTSYEGPWRPVTESPMWQLLVVRDRSYHRPTFEMGSLRSQMGDGREPQLEVESGALPRLGFQLELGVQGVDQASGDR